MYVWIWRHLPGPVPAKFAQTLFLIALVIAALLFVIFPVLDAHLPITQVTVGGK